MSFSTINNLFSHFSDIHSVFTKCTDDLKSRAFALCQNTLSTHLRTLDGHEPLRNSWSHLAKKWESARCAEEKATCIQEGTLQIDAILLELSEELRAQQHAKQEYVDEPPCSLFDRDVPLLHTLFSHLNNLASIFAKKSVPDTTKMTLFKKLDGTISLLIDGLNDGCELRAAWEEMQKKRAELSPAAFVQEAACPLSACTQLVQQELNVRNQLREAINTPKAQPKDVSLFQKEEVRALLFESLSEKVKQQQKELPQTFQAADAFMRRVLEGAYGDSLRAHIIDGSFTQEHFLVLLLADLVRRNGDIHAVEIFSQIATEDLDAISRADISNEALFHWISSDNATLPEAHAALMRGIVQARFRDEKEFAALREYLSLRYAPNAGHLLYLARHSKESDLLKALPPLVEKSTFMCLTRACELISCQDDSSTRDHLTQFLDSFENKDAQQEWLERVILGIAETRGPFALELTDLIMDDDRRTDTREAVVIAYSKIDYEGALELLEEFKRDPFIAAAIAVWYAKTDPKISLDIAQRLLPHDGDEARKVIAEIVAHHFHPPHLDGILLLLPAVPAGFLPLFFASIAIHLAEQSTLSAAHDTLVPHVPEWGHSLFLMEIARYVGKDASLSNAYLRLTRELGKTHQSLFSAALLSQRLFSCKATPEVFAEELTLLETIQDPHFLGMALSHYLSGNTMWSINELDGPRVELLKERTARLLSLMEKTRHQPAFGRLQYLACLIVLPFDKALAIDLLTSIDDISIQRMALDSVLGTLQDHVVHVVQKEMMASSRAAIPPLPCDFGSLPAHFDVLRTLVKQCTGDNTSLHERLCSIIACFSPLEAISLLRTIEDGNAARSTLVHTALIALTRPHITPSDVDAIATCFSEISDSSKDSMTRAGRPHMMERHHALHLHIVHRLVRNPEACPSTSLHAVLTGCVKQLGACDPWGCLSAVQHARDPRFLVESLAITIIPHLFHLDLLQENRLAAISQLLERCQQVNTDSAYGALAFACAMRKGDAAHRYLSKIADEEAKAKCETLVRRRAEYATRYRLETFDDEQAHAQFAIEIAPYLPKEALEIAGEIKTPELSEPIVRTIVQVAEENGTLDMLAHYAHEIGAICGGEQDDLESSGEEP